MAKATTPAPVVDPAIQDMVDSIEITLKTMSIPESISALEASVAESSHPFKSHIELKIAEIKRYL